MNGLQTFNNSEFGDIRTVTVDGEPMFCLADLCRALDIGNASQAKTRLNDDGVITSEVMDSMGRKQNANFISESNMYKLIFQSRKESAERFTEWVTSEVLPTIRRTGSYQRPMTLPEQIQILAQGHIETEKRISRVEQDLETFKNDMPLLAIECQRIVWAKNNKVVPLLGGRKSEAYNNKSLRGRVYSDLDKQLKREFGVNSYKAIKRNQCDLAIEIIEEYELPLVLKEEIEMVNSQLNMGDCYDL